MWTTIARQISATTGKPFTARGQRSVGGGCINATAALEDDGRKYFVKYNDASKLDMFKAEATGLQELAKAQAVRVPEPICWGIAESRAYIVLEYLQLGKTKDAAAELLDGNWRACIRFRLIISAGISTTPWALHRKSI